MAFGFAGAAAGASESLDTLLAKRRAEALARQELEQRRVVEVRQRDLADARMAEVTAARADRERQTGRTEARDRLALIPVDGQVPQDLVKTLQDFGLGESVRQGRTPVEGPRELGGPTSEMIGPYTGEYLRNQTEAGRDRDELRDATMADDADKRKENERIRLADEYFKKEQARLNREFREANQSGRGSGGKLPQEVVGIIKDIASGHGMAGNIPTRSEALQQFISNWGVITNAHPRLDVDDVQKMFNALLPETASSGIDVRGIAKQFSGGLGGGGGASGDPDITLVEDVED